MYKLFLLIVCFLAFSSCTENAYTNFVIEDVASTGGCTVRARSLVNGARYQTTFRACTVSVGDTVSYEVSVEAYQNPHAIERVTYRKVYVSTYRDVGLVIAALILSISMGVTMLRLVETRRMRIEMEQTRIDETLKSHSDLNQ